jgi:hypothetical protein
MLSRILIEMIERYRGQRRATRVVTPSGAGDPYYAFLLMPRFPNLSDETYRRGRYQMLEALCMVTKVVFPDAEDIVGIATETEPEAGSAASRSEDLMYFDARGFSEEQMAEARSLQADLGLLTNATMFRGTTKEYPDVEPPVPRQVPPPGRNPRNKPCPCGSGLKYKKCHGR